MVNDPIGDMIAQIKNASMAKNQYVALPHSRMKEAVAALLVAQGYLASLEATGEMPKRTLRLGIKYDHGEPAIRDIKRISKPGLRWYVPHDKIPNVVGGMGIAIVSTSRGIMTGGEAKKLGIGGEVLCTVW